MERKRPCNCISDCPCYPDCDRMMDSGQFSGQIPPNWLRWQAELEAEDDMAPDMGQKTAEDMRRMDASDPMQSRAPMLPEEENERDWQKLKEMYPDMAKVILAEVEDVCDRMEYEGSMMFDSIPDKVRVRRMTDDIYNKLKDRYPVEEQNDQDDMFVMNQEGRRRYPPHQNWLGDLIEVLLYQEMFQRRCRRRGCRHW